MNIQTQQPIRAKETDVKPWSHGPGKTRFDYENSNWRLEEMLNEDFFGLCTYLVRPGDMIWITDCEDQIVVVRADLVDKMTKKIWLSVIERFNAMPVVPIRKDLAKEITVDPGLAYRWRATRGGGHSILTRSGEIVAINFPSKDHALHAIEAMYRTGNFTPPPGREPIEQFVKGAKLFRPVNYGQNVDRESHADAAG